jgi:lipoprotein-anchoring transpeptidase ErfK/SrfK
MRAFRLFALPLAAALLTGLTTIVAIPSIADAAQTVSFREDYTPGTVVIKYGQRRLYYVMGGGRAVTYPVGVGRAGKAWFGSRYIDGKRIKPAWAPPECHRGRLAEQSDGCRGADIVGRRICHPRHQCAGLGRWLRVVWLHPHAQQRHHGSVRPGQLRDARGGYALIRDATPTI